MPSPKSIQENASYSIRRVLDDSRMNRTGADLAVYAIVADICGRSGIKHDWASISKDIREEDIMPTWQAIIEMAMDRGPMVRSGQLFPEQVEQLIKIRPELWSRIGSLLDTWDVVTQDIDQQKVDLLKFVADEVRMLQTALFLAAGELSTYGHHTVKSPMDVYQEIMENARNHISQDNLKSSENSPA